MHRESSRDRILFFEILEIITRQILACLMGKTSMRATCSVQTEYRSDLISLTPIRYLNTAIRLRSNIFIKEILPFSIIQSEKKRRQSAYSKGQGSVK
jgi:hypothetical protein